LTPLNNLREIGRTNYRRIRVRPTNWRVRLGANDRECSRRRGSTLMTSAMLAPKTSPPCAVDRLATTGLNTPALAAIVSASCASAATAPAITDADAVQISAPWAAAAVATASPPTLVVAVAVFAP